MSIINDDDTRLIAIEHPSTLRQMLLLTIQGLMDGTMDVRRAEAIRLNADSYINATKQQWNMHKELLEEQRQQVGKISPLRLAHGK